MGACLLVVGILVSACGGATSTAGPSPSLVTLDFTPLPSTALPSLSPTTSPGSSAVAASWPVGWDVAFCTAYADTTVAHELVIDIERAVSDGSKSDAQGLSGELAQTAPIASAEVTRLKDWTPAAALKADLTNMLDLDAQAADAYQNYFTNGGRATLRQARQLRNQVGKQVGPANTELQQLAGLGLSCPGTDLKLETF